MKVLTLKFDSEKFARDLCDAIVDGTDVTMEHFRTEAMNVLHDNNIEITPATIDYAERKIHAACLFHALSVLKSYGTGELMTENNEFLQEYMESELWNRLRSKQRRTIVGREKGPYVNVFGKVEVSSGEMAGKPILTKGGKAPDIDPNFGIQGAEIRLQNSGYIYRDLRTMVEIFMSRVNLSDYFTYGEINL